MIPRIAGEQLERAVALWKQRLGTLEIARVLGVHEAAVYNGLAGFRELQRKLIVEAQDAE